jgi:uncharacterized protein YjiS (DUF1127 family)
MSTLAGWQSCRHSPTRIAFATIVAPVADGFRAIRSRHKIRLATRYLQSMSDSALKDIGIHRGQLELVVNGLDLAWARRRNVEH